MLFQGADWESRVHGKTTVVTVLIAAMMASLLAIPFITHFLDVGIVFGIDIVIFFCLLVAVCVVARKMRWQNPRGVFALAHGNETHEGGIYYTQVQKNATTMTSYFFCEFSNMSGYKVLAKEGELTTATVFFKTRSNAGIMGNLKSITLVLVENFDAAKQILEEHGVNEIVEEAAK